MYVWRDKYFSRQLHIYRKLFSTKHTSTHTYWKKAIRVRKCWFGGINSSSANFASTCFYSDFHAKGVVVHLAGKIIVKSSLNAPNNSTVKPTINVVVLTLSLHPSLLLPLPLPITSAGTIIGSPPPPLHCCVPNLHVDLCNSILFVYQ
jgi:hypothetical protein